MQVADFCFKAFPHLVKHMLFEMQKCFFPAGTAALPLEHQFGFLSSWQSGGLYSLVTVPTSAVLLLF